MTPVCSFPSQKIGITFFGQAGFYFTSKEGYSVAVDLYLSDCCARYFGFKRLMPYLCDPRELCPDLLISTHAHYDHFDPDAVPVILSNGRTSLLAAHDVKAEAERLGLEEEKITYMKVSDTYTLGDIAVEALPCDHGPDTPHAIGLLLTVSGRRIVIAGDTCFHEDAFASTKIAGADLLILPINGTFGNLNETEAAMAADLVKPELTVPCHYWNFAEHEGNPAIFAAAMKERALPYLLMRPGESISL